MQKKSIHTRRNDLGLTPSHISYLIAMSGKPHTIGEELVVPAICETIKTVVQQDPKHIINFIPLSDNTVAKRIDEMAADIDE